MPFGNEGVWNPNRSAIFKRSKFRERKAGNNPERERERGRERVPARQRSSLQPQFEHPDLGQLGTLT